MNNKTSTSTTLFAIISGLSVANIYYSQPLLDQIAHDFNVDNGSIGLVITLTQLGYALGLFFLVPLGDLFHRPKLILSFLLLSTISLLSVSFAQTYLWFLASMIGVGILATVIQILVAYAATLAAPNEAGRAVGKVTSGIVIGILLSRTTAGFLSDLSGWRSVYLTSSAVTLVLTVLLSSKIKEDSKKSVTSYQHLLKSTLHIFIQERVLRDRAIIAMLIFATFSSLWTSLVLPLTPPPYSLSHSQIGLFGLAGLAGALAASHAGRLADRGLHHWTTGVGLVTLAISWFVMSFFKSSLWFLVLGILLLDFAVQAVHVTNQSLIFPLRPDAQSRIVAAYMIFYSIGSGLGAISSTAIYSLYGWTGVCILGGLYSSIALSFWIMTSRRNLKVNFPE